QHDWTPLAELLLICAARAQHVERVIRPALAEGKVVVCDRYAGSTIAYQGAGRGIPVEQIHELHRIGTGDLWPDLTVILDIDAAKGRGRSLRRLRSESIDEGRFEAPDAAFHERVRRSFLAQAEARPTEHAVIDADRPLEQVHADVVQRILAALGTGEK